MVVFTVFLLILITTYWPGRKSQIERHARIPLEDDAEERAVPTKIEKDTVTGTDTTGHEWDGLKELNTPLPKWWLYVFYATVAWALVWCVLYPSWPGVTGYFHGVLGYSQRDAVDAEVRASRAACQCNGQDGALSFAANSQPIHS